MYLANFDTKNSKLYNLKLGQNGKQSIRKVTKPYLMVNLFHEMAAFLTEGALHEFYTGLCSKIAAARTIRFKQRL